MRLLIYSRIITIRALLGILMINALSGISIAQADATTQSHTVSAKQSATITQSFTFSEPIDLPTVTPTERQAEIIQAIRHSDAISAQRWLDTLLTNNTEVTLYQSYLKGIVLCQDLAEFASAPNPDELIQSYKTYQSNNDHPIAWKQYSLLKDVLIDAEDWERFHEIYQNDGNDVYECAYRRYWLENQKDTERALKGYESFWRKGYAIPRICDPLTQEWQSQGGRTQRDLIAKYHNAINQGQIKLARQLVKEIDAPEREALERWIDVSINPNIIRDEYQNWQYPQDDTLLRYGLRLLITQDSVANKALFNEIWAYRAPSEDDAQWQALRDRFVLYLLNRNDRSALKRLFERPAKEWTRAQTDWYVRTMMRAGKANIAYTYLERENPDYQYIDRKGRIADYERAESLSTDDQLTYNATIYQALLRVPSMQRALHFWQMGANQLAVHEWQNALSGLDDIQLEQAILIAYAHQWPSRMIRIAVDKGLKKYPQALFPQPYQEQVQALAKRYGLDAALIYAIMREESLFDPRARSSANAYGLMQLLPDTAEAVADQYGIDLNSVDQLYDPYTNIRLGTAYLVELFERYQRIDQVIAAYNAGPNAIASWNPDIDDSNVWVEIIPYKETRSYVARVLNSMETYQKLYGTD